MDEIGRINRESLNQVRAQTARWLRQRSANAALMLSSDGIKSFPEPSTSYLNRSDTKNQVVVQVEKVDNQVYSDSGYGADNKSNEGNDKENLSCAFNIPSIEVALSKNSKVQGSNAVCSKNKEIKEELSKSVSLRLDITPSSGTVRGSLNSLLATKTSSADLHHRKKSIYNEAVVSTDEGSNGALSLDLEQRARQEAERAMKSKKIFTIIGPYPSLRSALRKRGWVEKLPSVTSKSDGPDATQEHLEDEVNSELINVMSQVVRNCLPSLVFSIRAVDVNGHSTRSGQLVNHFARASHFTTKAGLCDNLKNVPWFVLSDPNAFYPRCYNLSIDEEKEAFKDDFRLTACCNLLKNHLAKQSNLEVVMAGSCSSGKRNSRLTSAYSSSKTPRKSSMELLVPTLRIVRTELKSPVRIGTDQPNEMPSESLEAPLKMTENDEMDKSTHNYVPDENITDENSQIDQPKQSIRSKSNLIPVEVLTFAIERCQEFISFMENEDLDSQVQPEGSCDIRARSNGWKGRRCPISAVGSGPSKEVNVDSGIGWTEFLAWSSSYVKQVTDEKDLEANPLVLSECRKVLMQMRKYRPQFEMEGCRNVWILKPGAKSRGRGIRCSASYKEIMEVTASSDSQCVVQKYIERPLLIYKTKFDIRQWFLVTDWSPLTVWFYLDCYLRFCSKEFTLDSFHVSIHLSNNSVQKHFSPDPGRSKNIPDDNMWTSDQFQEYLKRNGHGRSWVEYVIPEMKQVILCSLLCTQEHIECRKSAFELYGADFMLTEDLQPWLLEINSSPSMARNTRATALLVDRVMDDMLKVVLDRRLNKNCDTGRFELIYKQPHVPTLPNPNVSLTLHGRKIRKVTIKK